MEELRGMCRPIFPYELGDPDFSWLLSTFQEKHPDYVLIDSNGVPLVLVQVSPSAAAVGTDFDRETQSDKEFLEK
jgi:hypothetical protein